MTITYLHLCIIHAESLYDGGKAILVPDLSTDSDALQSIIVPEQQNVIIL